MSVAANPYAPPKARVEDIVQASSEAETIRREHIKHEASIRSIGVLYYLSSGVLLLAALGSVVGGSISGLSPELNVILGGVYLVFGVLMIFVGRGIRTLRPWARGVSIGLSGLGLLGFPAGTLINGYILYLLLSKKGQRIFAPDYPDIVAATPEVKYRTSILVWVVLVLLVVVIAVATAVAIRH